MYEFEGTITLDPHASKKMLRTIIKEYKEMIKPKVILGTGIWTPYGFIWDESIVPKYFRNKVPHEEFMKMVKGEKRWWE